MDEKRKMDLEEMKEAAGPLDDDYDDDDDDDDEGLDEATRHLPRYHLKCGRSILGVEGELCPFCERDKLRAECGRLKDENALLRSQIPAGLQDERGRRMAAEARCERYAKALREIVERHALDDCFSYHIARAALDSEKEEAK